MFRIRIPRPSLGRVTNPIRRSDAKIHIRPKRSNRKRLI